MFSLHFRWHLVVHGGIDGYSRLLVYCKVACDNRAETVFKAFMEAVTKLGVPERVRSDKGGENVLVAEYMLETRGIGRRSHITGHSVHNQRLAFMKLTWHINNIFN